MGQFDYSDDRTKASVSFPAHKFPYTASVYYQCNVRLCALQDPDCQKVNTFHSSKSKRLFYIYIRFQAPDCASRRSRRDTEDSAEDGQPATIEVYSGLYVNENAEIIDNDSDSVFAEKVQISQETYEKLT